MRKRIVSDSSCDLLTFAGFEYAYVSLKIRTNVQEYIDNAALDVDDMLNALRLYKGRSFTSCPNVDEWEQAYGDADEVYVFPISRGVSGSYDAAMAARDACLEKEPSRHIHVFDTRTAGPGIRILMEKLREFLQAGMGFDDACNALTAYQAHTALLFGLESVHNFVQNGRVSKLAAVATGALGIRIIGTASEEGKLEMLAKYRGFHKTLDGFIEQMRKLGCTAGKVYIGHAANETGAAQLRDAIKTVFSTADIEVYPMRGLCCYYAERGGLLVAFEK